VFADNHMMPYWIKNNAGWWADGKIGDAEFLDSMEFLISQDLILDANLSSSRQSDSNIPDWIKNNAGWWADGKIGDADFQSGLEYLAESNILGVSEYGFSSGYIGMLKTIDKNGVAVEFSTVDLKETVTSGTITDHDAGGAFDTSLIMPHSTYSITFEESGTYNFFSMVHPWHIGSIEITDFDLGPMKQEQERLEQERLEQERIEQERLEQERIEQDAFAEFNQEQEDPFLQQTPMHQMAELSESLGITVEPTGNLDKLVPGEYNSYDEVYIAYEYPISEEVPVIEIYTASTNQAGVLAGVVFYKHSSNDIAKQFRNELAMMYGLYDDVNLTSDSSCKAGTLIEFPALICSKNDVVVYVIGSGNISKLTKAILGNIKSSFMPIEPLYIIIGVVAIGGVIGAIAVAKRGSKTPKPTKQKPKPVKQKPKPVKQKPVEKKETSAFCENCGNTLNPKAKFCGSCGNQV